jgi:hypothetical protein
VGLSATFVDSFSPEWVCSVDPGDGTDIITIASCTPAQLSARLHAWPPGSHRMHVRVTNDRGLYGESVTTVIAR